MGFGRFVRSAGRTISRHSPKILAGLATCGVITTAVLVAKETPAAKSALENARDIREQAYQKGETDKRDLTIVEKIRVVAPLYVPAIISGVGTIGCVIGSTTISSRREAALSALYSASEVAAQEYQRRVVDMLGEKKESEVREAVAKDRADEVLRPTDSKAPKEVIVVEERGQLYIMDLTQTPFRSTKNRIDAAVNRANATITGSDIVTVNDLYYEMGMGVNAAGTIGDCLVFNHDNPIVIRPIYTNDDERGEVIGTIVFVNQPVWYK